MKKLRLKTTLPPRHDIPSFWRDDSKGIISLHLGENPFPPSPRVRVAIAKASQNVNRYPDTNALRLREKLAQYAGHGLAMENIILGNGSDELIDLACTAFGRQGKTIAAFEPSFFVYRFAAQRHGFKTIAFRRDGDFQLPPFSSLAPKEAVAKIALSFIANPNNPTGTLTNRERIISYIQSLPGVVVIDECYFEFCGETVIDLVKDYPNLIVFRSLSKSFGLSGLRLGYAAASRPLIEFMERYAMTFPVNVLAQAAGLAVLDDLAFYQERIETLIEWREQMQQELSALGLKVIPSQANFLLTLWEKTQINPAKALAQRGILVSDQTANVNAGVPVLRIAIGTEEENQRLIKAIKEMMNDE
ncbi:MAG: histidinol-phosphate transaminase [Candidatus Omnitrophota bacterium]